MISTKATSTTAAAMASAVVGSAIERTWSEPTRRTRTPRRAIAIRIIVGHAEAELPARSTSAPAREQSQHKAGDEDDLQHERQGGQDIELIDVTGSGDDDGKRSDDERLKRVEAHLGAKERRSQHANSVRSTSTAMTSATPE